MSDDGKTYFYYFDTVYVFEWLELIGPVITSPILAAIAFVLNLIVILIIRSKKNKKEKLFESRMFSYILFNSIFNCIECFIYVFKLLNICLGTNTLYCSDLRLEPVFQYLGIVLGYLSETMKTCSIVTGLFFSLERYVDACQSNGGWVWV